MAEYRVRLLDGDGRVVEERVIKAIRNYDASEMAARLAKAAGVKCSHYEVWLRKRRILHQSVR